MRGKRQLPAAPAVSDSGNLPSPERRRLLAAAGGGATMAAFGMIGIGGTIAAVPVAADGSVGVLPGFLEAGELETLRAVVDRLIPGPPEDPDPGALQAGCAEAIDALLAAFEVSPPLIFAGAPFSDRAGAAQNDFATFLTLDPFEELAWRIRIEGSQGLAAREFNGPVRGFQQIYREGLAHLDERAGGSFAALPAPAQELIMRDMSDGPVQEFVDVAFRHTLDAMYGPPEYGGNRDLAGWKFTKWDGDVNPDGYRDEQISGPDASGPRSSSSSSADVDWPRMLQAYRHTGIEHTLIRSQVPLDVHLPQLKTGGKS